MENALEPNLEPKISDRGFAYFEETETDGGAFVRVYESSSAEEPKIWMNVKQPEPDYPGQLEEAEATALMTLDQAKEIHAKLGAAIGYMETSQRDFIGKLTAEDFLE